MHDQINDCFHDEYENSKSELYSEMSNLNRMHVLEPAVPSTPSSSDNSDNSAVLSSVVAVGKGTPEYYHYKLNRSLELIKKLHFTSVSPDEIPGLFPLKKSASKKTKLKCITQGSNYCFALHELRIES